MQARRKSKFIQFFRALCCPAGHPPDTVEGGQLMNSRAVRLALGWMLYFTRLRLTALNGFQRRRSSFSARTTTSITSLFGFLKFFCSHFRRRVEIFDLLHICTGLFSSSSSSSSIGCPKCLSCNECTLFCTFVSNSLLPCNRKRLAYVRNSTSVGGYQSVVVSCRVV